jgi:hypothetical protein
VAPDGTHGQLGAGLVAGRQVGITDADRQRDRRHGERCQCEEEQPPRPGRAAREGTIVAVVRTILVARRFVALCDLARCLVPRRERAVGPQCRHA